MLSRELALSTYSFKRRGAELISVPESLLYMLPFVSVLLPAE
jgi:hypothetical protein